MVWINLSWSKPCQHGVFKEGIFKTQCEDLCFHIVGLCQRVKVSVCGLSVLDNFLRCDWSNQKLPVL